MNFKSIKLKYVVGIDEAGRGPLAGPLVLGGVLFKTREYQKYLKEKNALPRGIDSKKMSAAKREEWFGKIFSLKRKGRLDFRRAAIGHEFIDKNGMGRALRTAVKKLLGMFEPKPRDVFVLMDGGLLAPKEYAQISIIKGDEKEKIIGLASVVAKASRDRLMIAYAKKFPAYGFEKHKGYGTREHYRRIKKRGISPIHRRTFLKTRTRE